MISTNFILLTELCRAKTKYFVSKSTLMYTIYFIYVLIRRKSYPSWHCCFVSVRKERHIAACVRQHRWLFAESWFGPSRVLIVAVTFVVSCLCLLLLLFTKWSGWKYC